MTDLVNDILWFRQPDGGEMKISMGGWPVKEVERLKARLTDAGWELISHENKVEKEQSWDWPKWWFPTNIGIAIGFALATLIFMFR